MAESDKVVVNLATGLEDSERVTVAFLVAGAALEKGKQVAMFLTKEAVTWASRLCGVGSCDGCPPVSKLFAQYTEGGGELLVCPICFNARKLDESALVANARLAGATPALGLDRGRRYRVQLLERRRVGSRRGHRCRAPKEGDSKDLRLRLR